jgi:hypothetical protein
MRLRRSLTVTAFFFAAIAIPTACTIELDRTPPAGSLSYQPTRTSGMPSGIPSGSASGMGAPAPPGSGGPAPTTPTSTASTPSPGGGPRPMNLADMEMEEAAEPDG